MKNINENNYNNILSIIAYIDIRFGDPICSISVSNENIITGTMLGRIISFNFITKNYFLIAETSTENITGIYEDKNKFYITIGDEKITEYENNNSETTYRLYSSEEEHKKYCDDCYSVLYKNYLFRLMITQPDDNNIVIYKQNSFYEIQNIIDHTSVSGSIEMTNYIVPLDFNLDSFLWIEFKSEILINICVFYFSNTYDSNGNDKENNNGNDNQCWKYAINKEYGRINQGKLINGTNMIFIIRNLNICEIRKCDNNFSILYSFNNIGDHAIAVDIIYNNINENLSKDSVDNLSHLSKYVIQHFNTKKEVLKNDNIFDIIQIFILDIEGNLNIINNNGIKTLLNLNECKKIKKEHKDKGLFSLGYPYLLKVDKNRIIFTTDYGLYCLKF